MKRLFHGSPYASVTATMALAVALGGTSHARGVELPGLPHGSVGGAQLKSNAITTTKVMNGSLLARDFKIGELPSGPVGPAGPQGPAGPTSTAAFDHNASASIEVAVRATQVGFASCDAGMTPVGGGVYSWGQGMIVESSFPSATRWTVVVRNDGPFTQVFTVHVMCTAAPSVTDKGINAVGQNKK
jgi:hypothetical protein